MRSKCLMDITFRYCSSAVDSFLGLKRLSSLVHFPQEIFQGHTAWPAEICQVSAKCYYYRLPHKPTAVCDTEESCAHITGDRTLAVSLHCTPQTSSTYSDDTAVVRCNSDGQEDEYKELFDSCVTWEQSPHLERKQSKRLWTLGRPVLSEIYFCPGEDLNQVCSHNWQNSNSVLIFCTKQALISTSETLHLVNNILKHLFRNFFWVI